MGLRISIVDMFKVVEEIFEFLDESDVESRLFEG